MYVFELKVVFCVLNCSDLLREKTVLVTEKKIEIQGWKIRICKNFEITRTIHSNIERTEQSLTQNGFRTYFWRFLRSNKLEHLQFKLEKMWDLEIYRKSKKNVIFTYITIIGELIYTCKMIQPGIFSRL